MRVPVVGLPTRSLNIAGEPPRVAINRAYVRALEAAGCVPVLIPLIQDEEALHTLYERLDGIVFPGGDDVAPAEYGEEPIGNLNVVDPPRDRTELALARWATADDLPVLGICRGQQLVNVALGGTLYQDLLHQRATTVQHAGVHGRPRNQLIHTVKLEPASQLAQLIDETDVEVNSLHHQAVKDVAPGLRITGRSPDGVIEALESADHRFLITVQWHPEEIADLDWVQRLFRAFVDAAGKTQHPSATET